LVQNPPETLLPNTTQTTGTSPRGVAFRSTNRPRLGVRAHRWDCRPRGAGLRVWGFPHRCATNSAFVTRASTLVPADRSAGSWNAEPRAHLKQISHWEHFLHMPAWEYTPFNADVQ